MAKTPEEMKASMIAGLKEKTGKSLDEWLILLKPMGLSKHKDIVTLLKNGHGLTHGFANMIALQAIGSDSHTANDGEALVKAQYAGKKAALEPLYYAVIKGVQQFGNVEIAPKKAYVSLRRQKQFAILQPSTATRLDVGMVLKEVEPGDRLELAGSFNAMMTHRVRLENLSDVDKELFAWLRKAYEQA